MTEKKSLKLLTPLPEGKDFGEHLNPQTIGMVHIPCTSSLLGKTSPTKKNVIPSFKGKKQYLTLKNIQLEFKTLFEAFCKTNKLNHELEKAYSGFYVLKAEEIDNLENKLFKLPFVKEIIDFAVEETQLLIDQGYDAIQIENTYAPYTPRYYINPIEILIMDLAARILRDKFPDFPMGIQMLSSGDNYALEIAIKHNFCYVRSESSLFTGIRPDGEHHNQGNIYHFYSLRKQLNEFLGRENESYPKLFVDILKKHTYFSGQLLDLKIWLDNIDFMEIEGIIITGEKTGDEAQEKDLIKAHSYLRDLKIKNQKIIPLIVGSGAKIDNIERYYKYTNAVIIGSSLKIDGNWKNRIDPEKSKDFISKVKMWINGSKKRV